MRRGSPRISNMPSGLMPMRTKTEPEAAYRDLNATSLYCPKCKQAMPVRQKMLLVLPGGDLFDYVCVKCGTSLGTRKA